MRCSLEHRDFDCFPDYARRVRRDDYPDYDDHHLPGIPRERQAYAMGLWSLASMLAPVIGPTLGGWLVQYFGWKSIFILNIPIGLISMVIVSKFIPFID